MADEAVVRIVVTETGTPGPASGGAAARAQPGRGTPLPPARDPNQTGGAAGGAGAAPAPSAIPAAPPRDWVADLVRGIEGANRHVLIEGQSGSGKSLLTREIAFQRMERGEEVHVVDTHSPETWRGARGVFQGAGAGAEAADFLKEVLEARKKEAQEAKQAGQQPQFKDMTVVFSDFARLMKDSPQLREEFKTLLTEARKFRISIVADTTALTGAATGIKGIQDVLQNFGQKVKLYAPTADDPRRTAEIAGKEYETPRLSEHKDRIDYGLVKPYTPVDPRIRDQEAREVDEAMAYARLMAEVHRRDKEAARERAAEEKQLARDREANERRLDAIVRARLQDEAGTRRQIEKDKENAAKEEAERRRIGEAEEADRLRRHASLRDALARQEADRRRTGEAEEEAQLRRHASIRDALARQETDRRRAAAKEEADQRRAGEAEEEARVRHHANIRDAMAAQNKDAAREEADRRRAGEAEEAERVRHHASIRDALARQNKEREEEVERDRKDKEKEGDKSPVLDLLRSMRGRGAGAGANVGNLIAGVRGMGTAIEGAGEASAAAGGGLAGAAAAAGPIIEAAVLFKQAVHEINQTVIGGIRGAIGGVGGFAQAAADPSADPSVPLGKLGDAASSAGEVIADKFSPILGYATVVVGATVKALSGFMQALDQTAQRYAEYSAPIAQALAVAEVRQTLGDIRRAGEVSAEMTRYIAAQSDLQQKFEDVKVKLLVRIMPIATQILEIVEALVPSGEGIENAIRALISPLLLIPVVGDKLAAVLHEELKPPTMDPTDELLLRGGVFDRLEGAPGGTVPDR